jgi:hypothetical protein
MEFLMTLVKPLSTLILGFSALLAGCSDPDMLAGARGIDDPTYSTMTGTPGGGNGGTNKYSPYVFNELMNMIYESTTSPLTGHDQVHDVGQSHPMQGFDDHPGGASTLDYVARCALNDGDWVATDLYAGYGQGILSKTTEWKTDALALDAKEDLFSCLMAHLNPFNVEVPIYLSGYKVQIDSNFDASDYIYDEALWVTEIEETTAGPKFHLNVWPLGDLVTTCTAGTPTIDGLMTRACGTLEAWECGINVHADVGNDCQEVDGYYTCLGRPAIRTMLRAVDMSVMYPTCVPPPR